MDCPKCHKKMKRGHACHAPQVLQVNSPCEVTTFHTVQLSSEAEFPVTNGAYKNTIVEYAADGTVYLYNSDGIPASLTPDSIRDFDQLIHRPKYNGNEMTSDTDIPNLTDEVGTLTSDLAAETLAREQADNTINDAINKVVMTDLEVNPNPSTTVVQLDTTKTNIKTGATTTGNVPLPVASTTQAGVMNSAIFNAIAANANDIQALMNGAVAIAGLSATPSQADLTTAWENETGLPTLMNRAGIFDVDNDKVWTYYVNTDTWYAASNTAQVTINTFTNSSEGVIKGSANVGQVFAESDGTGSVNGWDALSGTVADHTSQIAAKANAVDLATVATSGSYLDLTNVPTNVSDFANDAGYQTASEVEDAIEEHDWKLIASTVLAEDTLGLAPLTVDIPAEYQGGLYDYKVLIACECVKNDTQGRDEVIKLTLKNIHGWADGAYPERSCDRALIREDSWNGFLTTMLHQTTRTMEWTMYDNNDSCVSETIFARGYPTGYWNFSGTAGGISRGRAAINFFGGRTRWEDDILAFRVWAGTENNRPLRWLRGGSIRVFARLR